MGIEVEFVLQYDPTGKRNQNLYYHFVDDNKPDILIAKIRKADTNTVSFKVSNDYEYLVLRSSQKLSIANIKYLEREITFNWILKMSQDITYVSYKETELELKFSNC